MRSLALFALLVVGCDNFHEVQKADTITAYEGYLAEHPDSRFAFQATNRLEELILEDAKDARSIEAYDAYLERFPEGLHRERAITERKEMLWFWANETHTPEAWQLFLDGYPEATKKQKVRAQRALKVAEYPIQTTPLRVERINLAEDPEGPLNGWSFETEVTNGGDETLTKLELTISYLDANGHSLDRREWPVAAPYWAVPMEDEYYEPMKPGDTRTWVWTTGDLPEGWSQQADVYPSHVIFEDEQ